MYHVKYKGTDICELNGDKTLKTSGKYCEGDISIVNEEVEEKDINFYDYDGTLVESWSLDELQSKTELPANPSHEGLTAQGWNWTLAELKADNGVADVGQNYITTDGKTKFYLHFDSQLSANSRDIYLNLSQNVADGVEIDWGDGSATETYSSTGVFQKVHSYASGDYVLTLLPTDSCTLTLYDYCISSYGANDMGCANVYKIEIGKNVKIQSANSIKKLFNLSSIAFSNLVAFDTKGFSFLFSLKCFVYPSGTIVEAHGSSNSMGYNYSLKTLCFPKSITEMGWYSFGANANSITRINLRNITQLNSRGLQGLYNVAFMDLSSVVGSVSYASGFTYLEKIIFGSGITGFDGDIMRNCTHLREVHFKGTTPPTLANANAFSSVYSGCVFYVPTGTLSAYTSATNYPDPSVYTYVEE